MLFDKSPWLSSPALLFLLIADRGLDIQCPNRAAATAAAKILTWIDFSSLEDDQGKMETWDVNKVVHFRRIS